MSLRTYYPLDGDTLPWTPPHLIVQWGPYCDDVIGFNLRRVHEYASDAARLASYLRGQPVELPIGYDRVIEGQQITVGIVGMVFRPTGAYLNAAIVFPLPWLGPGQHLGIGAREICFSPNGLGRTVELYLARDLGYRTSDNSWAINFKAPQEARGGMPRDSGTYVRFGRAGFEFLRIALEVEFPRAWMVPVPDDGSSPVRLRFTTTVRSTGDFIAAARMSRFSPAGTPGFEMQCDNVVLDFSDRDNPEGIEFPSGYRGETSSRTLAKRAGSGWRSVPVSQRSSRVGDAPTVVITPNDGFLEQRTRYRAEVMAFGQGYSGSGDVARLQTARTDEERQRIAREVATNERNRHDVYRVGTRQRIEQTVTAEFVTETLPDTLRDVDILVSYPRDRQRFFLTGECRDGYIQLRTNRQDLFNRRRISSRENPSSRAIRIKRKR